MGGSREVEQSPMWLAHRSVINNGQASMRVRRDGSLLISDHKAEQLRRMGLDPKKITPVQALQAIHLTADGRLGVARVGIAHSLRPVRSTPAVQTAEIAVRLVEIHSRVGAPGSKPKTGVADTARDFVGDVATIGENSRHSHQASAAKIQLQAALKAAQRPGAQIAM